MAEKESQLKFCPNCGEPLSDGDDFCPNCGFNIKKYLAQKPQAATNTSNSGDSAEQAQRNGAPKKPKRGRGKIWLIVVIVVVVLIGGAAALIKHNSDTTNSEAASQSQSSQASSSSATSSTSSSATQDSEASINNSDLSTEQLALLTYDYVYEKYHSDPAGLSDQWKAMIAKGKNRQFMIMVEDKTATDEDPKSTTYYMFDGTDDQLKQQAPGMMFYNDGTGVTIYADPNLEGPDKAKEMFGGSISYTDLRKGADVSDDILRNAKNYVYYNQD